MCLQFFFFFCCCCCLRSCYVITRQLHVDGPASRKTHNRIFASYGHEEEAAGLLGICVYAAALWDCHVTLWRTEKALHVCVCVDSNSSAHIGPCISGLFPLPVCCLHLLRENGYILKPIVVSFLSFFFLLLSASLPCDNITVAFFRLSLFFFLNPYV